MLPPPLQAQEEAEAIAGCQKGDLSCRNRLIEHNLRLVVYIAKKFENSNVPLEDLISIGTIGLMKAVGSFKQDYGSRFATYAIRCIDNEMLMHFRSRKKARGEVSLFEPIGMDKEGNQIQLVDVLELDEADVAEHVQTSEQIAQLMANIANVLSPREYLIVKQRFGLDGEEECTQREISAKLGISRSYVSRIEKKALIKLRKIVSG